MKGTHAKYGAFAYSSAYGYSVPRGCLSLEQFALASQLGVSDDRGEVWKTRRLCEEAVIKTHEDQPVLKSIWKPFPDIEIRTNLLQPAEATPNWHIRVHKIEAGREIMTADGAFAICNEKKTDGRTLDLYSEETCEGTLPKTIDNYDLNTPEGTSPGNIGVFAVSKGAVGIADLAGGISRNPLLVNADLNSDLVESRTVIPTLQHTIKEGETICFVAGIYATPSGRGVSAQSYLSGWNEKPGVPRWLQDEISTL